MKMMITGAFAALLALVLSGSLLAHHGLLNFDTTTPVRVKGTVVRFYAINPHSFIVLEQKGADGATQRWAVEGPVGFQLNRRGFASDVLKPGDVVEVCGYLPKERTVWQIASADPNTTSISGRLINAELLTMPDGREEKWGGYGVNKCFEPGHQDHRSK